MWWWFIYAKLALLIPQCNNSQGLLIPLHWEINFVANLPDGSRQLFNNVPLDLTYTYCPTPMMDVLMVFTAIGGFASLLLAISLISNTISLVFGKDVSQPASSTPLTFDELMQQLNKAAEEYLKQSK